MGAIQPKLDAAAPYGLEMRRESFYLSSWHRAREGDAVPRLADGHALVVPAGDLPALAAALEQARTYVKTHMPRPVPGWSPGTAEWTLREDGGEAAITGPWVDFLYVGPAGDAADPRVQAHAEITYADLPGFAAVVRAALGEQV
ncbi:hypothetical protein ACIRLA_46545 [Streptomyces sp. NPDC102364]|uniref:hypothetical protein n=1 Tax=Streptomyces sp. NPDC102364 TaxID=3366161 RepID=UPI0038246468